MVAKQEDKNKNEYKFGLMAEWLKRGTVNTFYRGSNPLKALLL